MKRFVCLIISVFIFFSSCKKEEGEGGNSSIVGKVYVKDYNSTFTLLQEEYYGPDVWVYIIYGDDNSYSDRTKTSYDGTYEFKYLRPGNYRVFAYSKDSTLQTNSIVGVVKDVVINKSRQTVNVDNIEIFD